MMKYRVLGTTTIYCEFEVDAGTAEEAEDIVRNNAYPVEYWDNTVSELILTVEIEEHEDSVAVNRLSASDDIHVEPQYTEEC